MRHLHLPAVDQHKALASCIPLLCVYLTVYIPGNLRHDGGGVASKGIETEMFSLYVNSAHLHSEPLAPP